MRNLAQFHRKLHAWYQTHGRRDLPWRNTRDPYAIYLSEVMLQQTQVKTVLERFYTPFLARFPTITALSQASQDEVLSAWQGLGYYSRAINLQKAAQHIVTVTPHLLRGPDPVMRRGDNNLIDELLTLPGIGRNTAHAIAAFAYHHPAPVMEANVKRVLCRIFALKNPIDTELWEHANDLLDSKNPFDYNQAMMDIGAMVCTKRNPDCPTCPANIICKGQVAPELYPAKKIKKKVPVRKKIILVQHDGAGYYLATPRKSRFLHGLYHFTETDSPSSRHKSGSSKKKEELDSGLRRNDKSFLGHISQSYSHFTLEADVYLCHVERSRDIFAKIPRQARDDNYWFTLKELHALPMSMAEKKILVILKSACDEGSPSI